MNKAVEDKILELNSKGYLLTEIANELSIDRNDVYNYLHPNSKLKYLSKQEKSNIRRIKTLARKHHKTVSVARIAKKVGRSKNSVESVIYDTKKVMIRKETLIDPKLLEDIIKYYTDNKNVSLMEMSRKFNLKPHVIRYRLKKAGIYTVKYHVITDEERQRIYKLHKQGFSIKQIANIVDRNEKTISKSLKQANKYNQ